MVTLEDLSHDKKAAILNLARLHGARGIRVYGSVARGQATEQSDLDLLVEWEPDRSLLDVIGLKQDLEDLLGVAVDIGSERGLHWFIRERSARSHPAMKSEFLYLHHIRERCQRVGNCVWAGRKVPENVNPY